MIDHGKQNLLGVLVDVVDYDAAVARIIDAAEARTGCGISAAPVHAVMMGALDREHRYRLNSLELVVPDGQPVRWGLRWLYGTKLPDRVYGPELTRRVCATAAQRGLPIYLYGSRSEVLVALQRNLRAWFPGLEIAGAEPGRYRTLSAAEREASVRRIRESGARVVLVGLGCPRQDIWIYELRDVLSMPAVAVGAAFDLHAGTAAQAPAWMGRAGLEWAFRLALEPRRLWRRYLTLNPLYVALLILQKLGRGRDRFNPTLAEAPRGEIVPG